MCLSRWGPGSDALSPVKVARSLYAAAFNFAPPGANPDPGMRPLWPSRRGQFTTKKLATLTFQKLARLGGMDSKITGHVCSHGCASGGGGGHRVVAYPVLLVRYGFIKIGMKSGQFHQKNFHQKPLSSKTIFIKNHFHQEPFSSKTTFIKNHFHQKPLSSRTTFIKNHFHQEPLSSRTTFIKNHFHQKPLSSKKTQTPKT